MNEHPASPRAHGQQAPAVGRAVAVLERLADSDRPRSLSALSRELSIGASSLLAILAPLRAAGVVLRDDAGRYALGPTLVGLGEAAARHCTALALFERAAGALAERTGETALLWAPCGDGFALVAVREGSHPLRAVPAVGLRLDAAAFDFGAPAGNGADRSARASTAGLVEQALGAGVWMIAAELPSGDAPAVVAVAGPIERLRGDAGAGARAALRAVLGELTVRSGAPADARPMTPTDAGSAPVRPHADAMTEVPRPLAGPAHAEGRPSSRPAAAWEQAGPIGRDELDEFLRQSHVATLSYVADDGYPATVPLWYAWDGAAFWLTPRPGAEWATHVRVDPRVSLAVSESMPPLRRVLARGRLEDVADRGEQGARQVAAELAARYVGCGATRPNDVPLDGPLLRLVPERLIAWRGLLRHPRVAGEAGATEGRPDRRQLG